MVSRKQRHKRKEARRYAERLFEKQRRHNRLYAKPGPYPFVIVLDNLKPSFNIGKIFRSADAFGAGEIHLVGTEYFDAKSAKGSLKWVPAVFHEHFEQCHEGLSDKGYTMFVLDPAKGSELQNSPLPLKSAFVFGHEEFGVSFDRKDYPRIHSLRIAQVGRVESLNVSVAASIVMYEYFRQHAPER